MTSSDEFEDVRRDPDPLRRGRRATELLTVYQQRATELARLRRAAVEEAHRERGMSYTDIAAALDTTKGRVTQIKTTAPAPERAFFGIGPVTIALPLREGVAQRERVLIAAEDSATVDTLESLLSGHSLASNRATLRPDTAEPPNGDTIIVCGPKSAPVAAELLAHDPRLGMAEHDGRWSIVDRATGDRYGSPSDDSATRNEDIGYLARHEQHGRVIVHIAGIHAIGSLGVARYLQHHLDHLFAEHPTGSFSLVVTCTYGGLDVTAADLAAGPYTWHSTP